MLANYVEAFFNIHAMLNYIYYSVFSSAVIVKKYIVAKWNELFCEMFRDNFMNTVLKHE